MRRGTDWNAAGCAAGCAHRAAQPDAEGDERFREDSKAKKKDIGVDLALNVNHTDHLLNVAKASRYFRSKKELNLCVWSGAK